MYSIQTKIYFFDWIILQFLPTPMPRAMGADVRQVADDGSIAWPDNRLANQQVPMPIPMPADAKADTRSNGDARGMCQTG